MIAVIFEARIAQNKQERYLSLAEKLKPLLSDIEGFISIERFQSLSNEGKILSLSWWENELAVLQWKQNILHIAGEVAVRIFDSLNQKEWITENGSEITLLGIESFRTMGLNLNYKNSTKVCCPCLDWSERRFHLGGQVGAAFLVHAEKQEWLFRHTGYREITISEKGHRAFAKYFGINH